MNGAAGRSRGPASRARPLRITREDRAQADMVVGLAAKSGACAVRFCAVHGSIASEMLFNQQSVQHLGGAAKLTRMDRALAAMAAGLAGRNGASLRLGAVGDCFECHLVFGCTSTNNRRTGGRRDAKPAETPASVAEPPAPVRRESAVSRPTSPADDDVDKMGDPAVRDGRIDCSEPRRHEPPQQAAAVSKMDKMDKNALSARGGAAKRGASSSPTFDEGVPPAQAKRAAPEAAPTFHDSEMPDRDDQVRYEHWLLFGMKEHRDRMRREDPNWTDPDESCDELGVRKHPPPVRRKPP